MNPILLVECILVLVLILLFLRVPIGFALGVCATLGIFLFFAWPEGGDFNPAFAWRPTLNFLSHEPYGFLHSYPLTMVPLFIGLGHVANRCGFTGDLFGAIRVWLTRLPGNLAIASIFGCAGFSAITGSSVACASAMSRIAVPEMLRNGYRPSLATASVAASGTLGSLIPPSLLFALYGIFTEQSIGKLFIAGIVPGLISVAGFVVVIVIWATLKPDAAPRTTQTFTREEKVKSLAALWPITLLFVVAVGGLYSGIFTPTEAAAISFVTAVGLGLVLRRINLKGLLGAFRETALQTAMVFVIAIGAKMLVSLIALTGFTPYLLNLTEQAELSDVGIILSIVVLFLFLGMFLDSIGIILIAVPITAPLVETLGFDLIWFGVIVIKLLEIGLVTPPVGMNVFVIKGMMKNEVELSAIFKGVTWFLLSEFVVLTLLLLFPILSLWLPNSM